MTVMTVTRGTEYGGRGARALVLSAASCPVVLSDRAINKASRQATDGMQSGHGTAGTQPQASPSTPGTTGHDGQHGISGIGPDPAQQQPHQHAIHQQFDNQGWPPAHDGYGSGPYSPMHAQQWYPDPSGSAGAPHSWHQPPGRVVPEPRRRRADATKQRGMADAAAARAARSDCAR